MIMAEYNVLSKQCPMCREASVVPIDGRLSIEPPTHRCAKCGAELKTSFTRFALWSVPVCLVSLIGMYFALIWIQQSQMITGAFRAGLAGAIVALAFAIPANVAMRGIVFCPFKS